MTHMPLSASDSELLTAGSQTQRVLPAVRPSRATPEPARLPTNLQDEYATALSEYKVHAEVFSLAANAVLSHVDDGDKLKMQLQECTRQLATLMDSVVLLICFL